MKTKNSSSLIRSVLGAAFGLAVFTAAFGGARCVAGNLASWQDTYWRWYYGGLTLPTDPNGNAEKDGVVLTPLPNAPGDGTPASIAVTLNAGQSFFLPFEGYVGTSYTDGTPPDPLLSYDVWQNMTFKLLLDGRDVMNLPDALQTYVPFYFNPELAVNFPPR